MSKLSENTQDIVDSVNIILNQLENITECIHDIDFTNDEVIPVDVYFERLISLDINEVDDKVNFSSDDIDSVKLKLKNYKESGKLSDLSKFFDDVIRNNYISYRSYTRLKKYIYNKLFNKKESE